MRIVSGGQSGVDRAALDAALERGLPCGGWCPAGRWAEDGPIPPRYPLRETPSADPAQRTEWNVRDSDATLVLTAGESPGTELTREAARRLGRPVYLWAATSPGDAGHFRRWTQIHGVRTLNVAGPRESEAPGVYAATRRLLDVLLGEVLPGGPVREGSADPLRIAGPGEFPFPVVGESRYREAFEEICGPPTWDGEDRVVEAALVLEDSNPHDPQAVRVDVQGKPVGYLSREDARRYRGWLQRKGHAGGPVACAGRIRGGWNRGGNDRGQYGLKLDLVLDDGAAE